MGLQLGEVAPDFTAETTEGSINFHDWIAVVGNPYIYNLSIKMTMMILLALSPSFCSPALLLSSNLA